jgi:hypothetical protein
MSACKKIQHAEQNSATYMGGKLVTWKQRVPTTDFQAEVSTMSFSYTVMHFKYTKEHNASLIDGEKQVNLQDTSSPFRNKSRIPTV